jgi:hypothetical protein
MKRIAILLAAMVAMPAQAKDYVDEIVSCMRDNIPSAMRVQKIELESVDRSGETRTLKGRLYGTSEQDASGKSMLRAMLRIDSPADLAGAAYLVRESEGYLKDGMYVYLPSVRRVRRVTGTFADGALLGTNFSYNDFKQLEGAFGDLKPELEPMEEVDGRKAYVLMFKGQTGENARFRAVRAWVDRKTCVPLRADFFEGDAVRKQLRGSADSLRQSGKYWYLSEMEMRDLRENTRTVLRVHEAKGEDKLPKRYFDPNLFYQAD